MGKAGFLPSCILAIVLDLLTKRVTLVVQAGGARKQTERLGNMANFFFLL